MEFIGLDHADLLTRTLSQEMAARFNEALREAKAEAWDEGHLRGTLDATSDLEPADNPYRD